MNSNVSVVIPVYNSQDTIVACVDSVINQTCSDFIQIIVVNDGSKDESVDILQSAFPILPDNRVLTIINKENGGVSSARNIGIHAAETEWIALLDSDDVWHSEKLDRQFSVIHENPNIQFLGANVNGEFYPYFGKARHHIFTLNPKQLIIKWYPSTPTILAKKSLLTRAGLFDEAKRRGEDCDLWLRCMMYVNLYILNESLVEIGHGKRPYGESGLSANLKRMFVGELEIVAAAFQRKQVGLFFSIFAFFWLFSKYLRREFLTKFRGA